MLKKAEEMVKKFNSLPEEQRYYYDPFDKLVIHITKLDQIRLEPPIYYKFKGHEINNENRWWWSFLENTFEFVTKEEAIARSEKDKARQKREIKKLENEITYLQNKLKDLKEECNNAETI